MRLKASHWLLVAAGGLLLPSMSAADDPSAEGVVRLGKAQHTSPSVESDDTGSTEQAGFRRRDTGCEPQHCPQNGRALRHDRRSARHCRPDHGCRPGLGGRCGHGCRPGYCGHGCRAGGHWYGHGAGYCGVCGDYGCYNPHCAHLMHVLHWLSPYHSGCTVPPDHGFAPPGKHPVQRTAATYRRWFPGDWTGEPSTVDPNFVYPMVYTPTDTTQLGFYYQRVPVWQRRAGMIPPTPQPDQWHAPDYGDRYNGGIYGAVYGTQGEVVSGDSAKECPADKQVAPSVPDEPAPIDATPPVPEIREGGSPEPPPA